MVLLCVAKPQGNAEGARAFLTGSLSWGRWSSLGGPNP